MWMRRRKRSAWEVGHSFIQELGTESRANKGLEKVWLERPGKEEKGDRRRGFNVMGRVCYYPLLQRERAVSVGWG